MEESLASLSARVREVRAERGFTSDPTRLVLLLVEEVGEVANQVKRTWSPNYPPIQPSELADELADVLVLLLALGEAFDIDVERAVQAKFIERDGTRTWASAVPRGPGVEPEGAVE